MDKTRERVLAAAKESFINKGYEGARMQEIADLAGINKGLLHYYFKTKENIFHEVINEVVDSIIPRLDDLINAEGPLFQKIRQFVEFYVDLLIRNPYLPAFIISEMNLRGNWFVKDLIAKKKINPTPLFFQIEMEIRKGLIKPIHPFSLLVNLASLCVFPFIARPVFQEITGLNESEYLQMMEERKREVADFVISSIEKEIYPNG